MKNLMTLRFKPPSKPKGIARMQPKKSRFIWWPTDTAIDRQRIEIGVPFTRKGERLIVERNSETGALKSRCLGKANQK